MMLSRVRYMNFYTLNDVCWPGQLHDSSFNAVGEVYQEIIEIGRAPLFFTIRIRIRYRPFRYVWKRLRAIRPLNKLKHAVWAAYQVPAVDYFLGAMMAVMATGLGLFMILLASILVRA